MAGPLNPGGNPGAFVALDPRNGEVLAMGSHPTFDPSIFTKPLTDARFKALIGEDGGPAPLTNRAISGAYPSASTFKPITALAALEQAAHHAGDDDPGRRLHQGRRDRALQRQGAGLRPGRPGPALQVSSDVYFYKLGLSRSPRRRAVQTWARRLGWAAHRHRPTGRVRGSPDDGGVGGGGQAKKKQAVRPSIGEDGGPAPLTNRAIAGAYPSASTFKPITALAALSKQLVTPQTTIQDGGCTQVAEIERCNAKEQAYGPVDLARALQVSSDVYFYKLGLSTFFHGGALIQSWARKLGLDKRTGIDLPGEFAGLIPDQKLAQRDQRRRARLPQEEEDLGGDGRLQRRGALGCGLSDLRDYSEGDNASLATGQGDVQATPLQMAVVYAALANGGKVVRPHLGLEIESPNGELIQRIERDPSAG